MHELSICRSIYDIADRAREGRAVETIHLQLGQLRQVVPQTLVYCWALVSEGTGLDGSSLDVDHIPIRLRCTDCAAETVITETLVLTCGECRSGAISVLAGEEFMLTSMDLKENSHG